MRRSALKNLIGRTFGILTVTGSHVRKGKKTLWPCKCGCGATKLAAAHHLLSGSARSCGCLVPSERSRLARRRRVALSAEERRTLNIWRKMHARCGDPRSNKYHLYGARGIAVCPQWATFAGFVNDMGLARAGLSIDRIDNDLGYCLSNCRWATATQQARNKRNSVTVTHDGRTLHFKEWAAELGIKSSTVYGRIRRGLNPLEVLQISSV